MSLGINKEDIVFLKALQHEMLTQDTVGQASPRFWVVRGTIKEYGVDSKWANGEHLIVDGENLLESMKDIYEYLLDTYSDIPYRYDSTKDIISYYDSCDKEWIDFYELENIKEFIEDLDPTNHIEIVRYKETSKIYENTFFLTNKECKAHIKANYYHYPEDAHSYAMTAWRAPEVERLYTILETINWDAVEKLVDTE